jgi:hypothetical protein
MHLDAIGIVVVDDLRDRVKLMVDGNDLTFPGDRIDDMGFGLELLVGVVLVLGEAKDDGVRSGVGMLGRI